MTIFSEIDLAAYDLDWFGMDAAGEIAHFTSAGTKLLPARVIQSREDLKIANNYFSELPQTVKASFAPGLGAWQKEWLGSEKIRSRLWEVFGEWGERGLYSFDCLIVSRQRGPYYMVAFPDVPLVEASLSKPIAQYLGQFRFPFCFRDLFSPGSSYRGREIQLDGSALIPIGCLGRA